MSLVAANTLGCGLGDESLIDSDPEAVPDLVTYAQHIKPRMDYYCVACHNPSGQIGNAGGWDYSTYALIRAGFASIDRVALQERRMPPGGARKLTDRDIAIFRRWQQQGFPK